MSALALRHQYMQQPNDLDSLDAGGKTSDEVCPG